MPSACFDAVLFPQSSYSNILCILWRALIILDVQWGSFGEQKHNAVQWLISLNTSQCALIPAVFWRFCSESTNLSPNFCPRLWGKCGDHALVFFFPRGVLIVIFWLAEVLGDWQPGTLCWHLKMWTCISDCPYSHAWNSCQQLLPRERPTRQKRVRRRKTSRRRRIPMRNRRLNTHPKPHHHACHRHDPPQTAGLARAPVVAHGPTASLHHGQPATVATIMRRLLSNDLGALLPISRWVGRMMHCYK